MSTRLSVISFKGASASRSKLAKPAFATRKLPYKVHLDGVDVTPRPLLETAGHLAMGAVAAAEASNIQNMANYMELRVSVQREISREASGPQLHASSEALGGAMSGIPSLSAVATIDHAYHRKSSSFMSLIAEESSRSPLPFESSRLVQKLPTPELREEPGEEEVGKVGSTSILLTETPFLELLELRSESRVAADPDYEQLVRDRERFVAASASGSAKTRADAVVQTADLWVRTRWTQERRRQKRNQHTMVTPWEIWDTENTGREEDGRAATLRRRQIRKQATEDAVAPHPRVRLSASSLSDFTASATASATDEPTSEMSEATDLRSFSRLSVSGDRKPGLHYGKELRLAAMVIERLLQERESRRGQMLYCGIPAKSALEPDIRYKYEPHILWTLQTPLTGTHDRCVTCIVWSTNPLIFAVGYGRYQFTASNPDGLVNVWSIKNPVLPERSIRLKAPANACAFSKRHPNLLAIGLMSGSMLLVDISTSDCPVIFESKETGEPLWAIAWLQMESHGEDEMLLAGTQDGRIMRFRRSEQFKSVQMMRVARSEGTTRGISRVKTATSSVPCSHYTAVFTLCECPTETDGYLVGTDDGCVHLCSAHYLHRHLAASACHLGPVYACEVSPFVNKIYLTCGADWTIRIWAHGIYDPLLTFSSSMEPVESVAWSPVDSCLFASVSGSEVSIWDLRRKIPAPAGTATWPDHEKLTVVSWAKDGALLVGDRAGKVHVMKVEGLPLPSFFQRRALATSIRKALKVTKPDLYAAFTKLGKPF